MRNLAAPVLSNFGDVHVKVAAEVKRAPRTRRRLTISGVVLVALVAVPMVGWERMVGMPGASFAGALPPLTAAEASLAEALRRDVEHIAVDLGERNLHRHEALEATADWIEAELRAAAHGPERQTFEVDGLPCHNLELELRGTEFPDELIIVGAHYDSAHGTPGANDNGSGVASLLALARDLRDLHPKRTLRLVWFTNEEPPHFQGPNMGSVRYAHRASKRGEHIIAMLSLETMGYYSDQPDSQHYPGPLAAAYPDTGNFIAFVGDTASRALVHRVLQAFRRQTRFPSEGAALPDHLPGIGWSDHWSFWQQGYPALMVSDTAPFRYPHYHQPEDTPDKLDYDRLARVVAGLRLVVAKLTEDGV